MTWATTCGDVDICGLFCCVDVSGHDKNEGHVDVPGICYKQGIRVGIVYIVHAVAEQYFDVSV